MPTLTRFRALAALPVLVPGMLATTLAVAPSADAGSSDSGSSKAGSSDSGSSHSGSARHRHLRHARHIALHQIGDHYAYGGHGPRRFDCSGLVYYSYRKAGFHHVPRTSDEQAHHARKIPKKDIRPGDFMYFDDGGGVYHVAIFLRWQHGHAVMLHAPEEGKRVQRDPSWTTHWYAGTLRGL